MSRIRIRCKDHEPRNVELEGGGTIRTHRLPDWTDVEVELVRDDGTTEPITCVNAIEWRIRPGETSTAVLEVVGPALEVDAELGARARLSESHELPGLPRGLDALCSDHRNAWARFAAEALARELAQPLDADDRAAIAACDTRTPEGAKELELELARIREEAVDAAARWADSMTDQWKRRFGG